MVNCSHDVPEKDTINSQQDITRTPFLVPSPVLANAKHTTLDLLLAARVTGLCQPLAFDRRTSVVGLLVLMLVVVVIVVVMVLIVIVVVVVMVMDMVIVGTGFRRLPVVTGLCSRLCGLASFGHVWLE